VRLVPGGVHRNGLEDLPVGARARIEVDDDEEVVRDPGLVAGPDVQRLLPVVSIAVVIVPVMVAAMTVTVVVVPVVVVVAVVVVAVVIVAVVIVAVATVVIVTVVIVTVAVVAMAVVAVIAGSSQRCQSDERGRAQYTHQAIAGENGPAVGTGHRTSERFGGDGVLNSRIV